MSNVGNLDRSSVSKGSRTLSGVFGGECESARMYVNEMDLGGVFSLIVSDENKVWRYEDRSSDAPALCAPSAMTATDFDVEPLGKYVWNDKRPGQVQFRTPKRTASGDNLDACAASVGNRSRSSC